MTSEKNPSREELTFYAFRALAQRALSAKELQLKLEKRCTDPQLVAEVLERTQELGYQNDQMVVNAEVNKRGVGRFRIQQKLKMRGLETDAVSEALESISPEKELLEATGLLSKRWDAMQRKRDPKSSSYAFLARRGFSGGIIWKAIEAVYAEQEEKGE